VAAINFVLTLLAALTSLSCTALLFRAYSRVGLRLLLWSALCFVCLSANNILLFVDLVVLPQIDLRAYRLSASLIGVLFLLYGFITETE
jgi:Family of unknown function (DUF5985)